MSGKPESGTEVLFIGGRSGVGKSTVGAEIFAQLVAADVQHCLIEGDNLDMAHPAPWQQGHALAEANLSAMWRNYRSLGYTRLIYTNTASVYDGVMRSLVGALGENPKVQAVLLTSSDEVADLRLAQRERGSGLQWHSRRSRQAARDLDAAVPAWVHRIDTDDEPVTQLAQRIVQLVGWTR